MRCVKVGRVGYEVSWYFGWQLHKSQRYCTSRLWSCLWRKTSYFCPNVFCLCPQAKANGICAFFSFLFVVLFFFLFCFVKVTIEKAAPKCWKKERRSAPPWPSKDKNEAFLKGQWSTPKLKKEESQWNGWMCRRPERKPTIRKDGSWMYGLVFLSSRLSFFFFFGIFWTLFFSSSFSILFLSTLVFFKRFFFKLFPSFLLPIVSHFFFHLPNT